MGRKKKFVGAAVTEVQAGDEDVITFSGADLARYELAQYKVANTAQGISLKKQELVTLEIKFKEAVNKTQMDIAGLTASLKISQAVLTEVQAEISKSYGLDLSKVSYDDVTGRVFQDGEPLRRTKKRTKGV